MNIKWYYHKLLNCWITKLPIIKLHKIRKVSGVELWWRTLRVEEKQDSSYQGKPLNVPTALYLVSNIFWLKSYWKTVSFEQYRWSSVTKLLVSYQSPECSDCLLRPVDQKKHEKFKENYKIKVKMYMLWNLRYFFKRPPHAILSTKW